MLASSCSALPVNIDLQSEEQGAFWFCDGMMTEKLGAFRKDHRRILPVDIFGPRAMSGSWTVGV